MSDAPTPPTVGPANIVVDVHADQSITVHADLNYLDGAQFHIDDFVPYWRVALLIGVVGADLKPDSFVANLVLDANGIPLYNPDGTAQTKPPTDPTYKMAPDMRDAGRIYAVMQNIERTGPPLSSPVQPERLTGIPDVVLAVPTAA